MDAKTELVAPGSNGIPAAMVEEYRALDGLSTEKLRDELAQALHLSAAYLRRLAAIVRLLEERGEDLSELKLDILPYLRLIAHGQLLPELLVRHGQSPLLLRIARSLPLPDQDRLAKGDHVPLVVRRPDGSFDHRLADPGLMGRDQITQVFASGRIRPIEEQILLMEARGKPVDRKTPPTASGHIRPDPARGGLVVGRTFVPVADVLEALRGLRESDDDDAGDDNVGDRKTVNIYLSGPQYERLRKAAYEGRISLTALARRALIAFGLI